MKTASFTGHRPERLGGYDKANPKNRLAIAFLRDAVARLKKEGYTSFISGGALGTDQWAAEVVLEDQELELVVAIPYKDYGSNWPPGRNTPGSREVLADLCSKAKKVHVVCEGSYAPHKNHERNKWMADNSDTIVAVWDGGDKGGTASAIRNAKKQGKRIIRYNPKTDSEELV